MKIIRFKYELHLKIYIEKLPQTRIYILIYLQVYVRTVQFSYEPRRRTIKKVYKNQKAKINSLFKLLLLLLFACAIALIHCCIAYAQNI